MRINRKRAFFISAVITAAMLFSIEKPSAYENGMQEDPTQITDLFENSAQEEPMQTAGLSRKLQSIPVCSRSFVKSLNAGNTKIWVKDPRWKNTPCCINGVICLPEPAYGEYVVATPELQAQYDCSKEARKRNYTPICRVSVGQALDPTSVCTACVPGALNFWGIVYQNQNKPTPPPPPPTPTPKLCGGKICTGKTRCINDHCVQVR